ncbi:MAG: hypothetical protein LKI24_11060 [Acidipropionibacterium sp.]|jgi:hypothetical protein|nr:hypothetical protein [Acidipropionibacterium sp.]
MNQNDADRILDLAHSETKSWGGDEASLTHAAKAIARKWPEEFKAAFGEDGAKQIDMLLRRHVFEGGRAQLDAILRQNDSIEMVRPCTGLSNRT